MSQFASTGNNTEESKLYFINRLCGRRELPVVQCLLVWDQLAQLTEHFQLDTAHCVPSKKDQLHWNCTHTVVTVAPHPLFLWWECEQQRNVVPVSRLGFATNWCTLMFRSRSCLVHSSWLFHVAPAVHSAFPQISPILELWFHCFILECTPPILFHICWDRTQNLNSVEGKLHCSWA